MQKTPTAGRDEGVPADVNAKVAALQELLNLTPDAAAALISSAVPAGKRANPGMEALMAKLSGQNQGAPGKPDPPSKVGIRHTLSCAECLLLQG